jgi:signal transduction histidine kinase
MKRILPRHRLTSPILIGAIAAFVLLCGLGLYRISPWFGLPYRDDLAHGRTREWTAYAGNWNLVDKGIQNNSAERGAKFITGSSDWTSYTMEAEMRLLGGGDSGVIVRASEIEQGVDSYSGYYAGLRTEDQSLVLGRASHGWVEFPPQPVPGGVVAGRWYRLKVSAYGCLITASVQAIGMPSSASIAVQDPDCLKAGKVGLRSVGAGGIWRNIRVTRPLFSYPPAPAGVLSAPHVALYPTSQGTDLQSTFPAAPVAPERPLPSHSVESIRNLRLFSTSQPAHVFVRGVVVLNSPALLIQDSTGGAEVQLVTPSPPKVGDEVEVEGDVYPHGLSATIRNALERPLGGLAPIPPLSVTAEQAATGEFDLMYIEVQGTLESVSTSRPGPVALSLKSGAQLFRATASSEVLATTFQRLQEGSLLRLRGVCTLDPSYTGNAVPFALILSAADDVSVLSGPPWWSLQHLIELALAMLGLGFVAHLLYSRAEQWKLQAVLDERERLAHEMHDTLGQSFAGIGFQLRGIRNRLSRGNTTDISTLQEEMDRACDMVRRSHDEVRRNLAALRPEALQAVGLVGALEQMARKMIPPGSVSIEVKTSGETGSMPIRILDTLFRIGQESLNNALQHGHPSQLLIEVACTATSVSLSISDNGKGFSPDLPATGFGIAGMRSRAESIGAALTMESVPGQGARVLVCAPLPRKTSRLRRIFNW